MTTGKRSAGLLLYRHTDHGLEVLLGHMGGPFFAKRDVGAWSVPKGEYEADEPAWDAARLGGLVLAGALMGGEIEKAVREVRSQGLLVISLNMAGSVPEAADLVVTDPVQAGVMAVMAVAETAKFTIERLSRRIF